MIVGLTCPILIVCYYHSYVRFVSFDTFLESHVPFSWSLLAVPRFAGVSKSTRTIVASSVSAQETFPGNQFERRNSPRSGGDVL